MKRCQDSRRRIGWIALALLAGVASLIPVASSRAQESNQEPGAAAPPAGRLSPGERQTLLKAWKAARRPSTDTEETGQSGLLPLMTGGTPAVGRASMVINSAGTIVYTRNFVGAANDCDVDLDEPIVWQKSTDYVAGDHVRSSNNESFFMATDSGTSGSSEPGWHATFGSSTSDGSVTWVCVGTTWAPGKAYTTGMTVTATSGSGSTRTGFTFQVQIAGSSGTTEPLWPTKAGDTVTDNGVTWKAIGYFPGSFRNCNPLQLVSRTAGDAETVIASEGDSVGPLQLSGWGEFIAMNSSGLVAFKAEAMGLISDRDEGGTGIFLAGPGAGKLTKVATAGDVIGGRYTCGFATMLGINNSGQVVFDGYSVAPGNSWQSLHQYPSGSYVMPTSPNGLRYIARTSGTSATAEPAFPTSLNATVTDGSIVWQAQTNSSPMACDEDNQALIRHSADKGNELLVAVGSAIGGSTVKGFGDDTDNANGNSKCSSCNYHDIDGLINSAGHVPVVLNLADGSQGVYILTGPGVAIEAARSKGSSLYQSIFPRVSINDSDQVSFKASLGPFQRIYRVTPPAAAVTVVSSGDDVGTRTVGVANGVTFESFGDFVDLNNPGNVVFQAKLSGAQEGFYYWDSSTGILSEIRRQSDNNALASEMITVNDRNLVAYVTGSEEENQYNNSTSDHEGGHETGGAFFWQAGRVQKAIAVGDSIGGDTVTSIYAQHQSFVRRQLSESGCLALSYHVLGDDPGYDCNEGGPGCSFVEGGSGSASFTKGGQLFVSCVASTRILPLPGPPIVSRVSGR